MANSTRELLITTAGDLFRRQGFHATGMNQILAHSGAPKGSLYFHFPGGKQQLAAEAVTRSAAEITTLIDAVLAGADTPEAAIRGVVDGLAEMLRESDFQAGCPIATVALDVASESDQVREACQTGYDKWTSVFADWMCDRGAARHTAVRLANITVSAVEGALLLARVRRDLTALWQIRDHLSDVVSLALAEGEK